VPDLPRVLARPAHGRLAHARRRGLALSGCGRRRKPLADAMLDNQILKELNAEKW